MITYPASSYDIYELNRQLKDVESAPLADRKEAQADWIDAMINCPETVSERVSWLIDGNYGAGSYSRALQIVQNKRMNRVAALAQMIAALEWRCSNVFARSAWNKLTAEQQNKVNGLIMAEIEHWEEENKE